MSAFLHFSVPDYLMPFRDISGQEDAIELIFNAVRRDRIPHAWLFTGQANIGKFKTAVALTKKLNCSKIGEDSCGKCNYCLQIEKDNFPDLLVIRPEGKFIGCTETNSCADISPKILLTNGRATPDHSSSPAPPEMFV